MAAMILGLFSSNIMAQVTNYYTLTKIIDYGKETTKCNGGQFVKISKNICYDVDSKGNDVGNGKLYLDISNSTQGYVYIGSSYHGKSRYLFSPDYSSLVVEINPHYKYVYKKATAPSDIDTCTLIKKESSRETEQSINVYDNSTPYSAYPQGNNHPINTNKCANQGSSTQIPNRKFKCAYCNGTGRIEKNDNASASFGQNKSSKRCTECGKVYNPAVFTHYHIQCRHCGGTGSTH